MSNCQQLSCTRNLSFLGGRHCLNDAEIVVEISVKSMLPYDCNLKGDNGYSSNIQTGYHTRSNSFPSRSHPLTSEVDEHLSRLASSESASTSLLLNYKRGRLQDLHDCIEKLLQLPFTQQILSPRAAEGMRL
ncbi:putative Eukaryotic translation initiation factor 3 subunit A [Hibiscus syriacus]|uniref:Eukaryotic translation initiation factor 3 subunit A n=1 Tax=Hibiscus syriacus TaxID=106335 RepID=A0A6A2ZBU4_HIBSY|nr:putative Eukaryotic translation initiation factor 3 subunit A [Hibiscus syriacus]